MACLSRVHTLASSFLRECTYRGSTSRPTFDLFPVRSFPALALAAFGSCQPQHTPQAPASHLASPIPSCCCCCCLHRASSHLTSPPPLRRRRPHSAPSSAPLVITTARTPSSTPAVNHHLLNHHTRSGGRARPAPFSLTPPDRHRPSTLAARHRSDTTLSTLHPPLHA